MERCVFDNGLFEYLELEESITIDGKEKNIKRSFVRRPPGIRALIINKENKILLSREFRYELSEWDYRLPGGKVFDTIEDFRKSLKNSTVDIEADKTVTKEVLEEVGLIVNNQNLIKISKDGATVIWDLYYYEITDFQVSEDGNHLEEGELIDGYDWYSFDEVINLCKNGAIHEDRTVGVLLTYILNHK